MQVCMQRNVKYEFLHMRSKTFDMCNDDSRIQFIMDREKIKERKTIYKTQRICVRLQTKCISSLILFFFIFILCFFFIVHPCRWIQGVKILKIEGTVWCAIVSEIEIDDSRVRRGKKEIWCTRRWCIFIRPLFLYFREDLRNTKKKKCYEITGRLFIHWRNKADGRRRIIENREIILLWPKKKKDWTTAYKMSGGHATVVCVCRKDRTVSEVVAVCGSSHFINYRLRIRWKAVCGSTLFACVVGARDK